MIKLITINVVGWFKPSMYARTTFLSFGGRAETASMTASKKLASAEISVLPTLGKHTDKFDVLDVVQNPDEIRSGYGGASTALRGYGRQRYLAVIYREVSKDDGFIITARFVRKKPGRRILC